MTTSGSAKNTVSQKRPGNSSVQRRVASLCRNSRSTPFSRRFTAEILSTAIATLFRTQTGDSRQETEILYVGSLLSRVSRRLSFVWLLRQHQRILNRPPQIALFAALPVGIPIDRRARI